MDKEQLALARRIHALSPRSTDTIDDLYDWLEFDNTLDTQDPAVLLGAYYKDCDEGWRRFLATLEPCEIEALRRTDEVFDAAEDRARREVTP